MKCQIITSLSMILIVLFPHGLLAQGEVVNFSDTETTVRSVEPFESGFGHTIGNSLRRQLLSSLDGYAYTQTPFDGADHEFNTIRGIEQHVYVGGILNIPLNSSPRIQTVGGGLTFGMDRALFARNNCVASGLCAVDVIWSGFPDDIQANQLGGTNQEADRYFQIDITPGFRFRRYKPNGGVCVFDITGLFGWNDVDQRLAPFDPNKEQVIVQQHIGDDFYGGFKTAIGLEHICRSGHLIRPMFGFKGYQSNIVTGNDEFMTFLFTSLEFDIRSGRR